MKNMITASVVLLMSALMSGCAGPPKAYQINSTSSEMNSSGIAFVKVTGQRFFGLFQYSRDTGGRGIGIRNKETGEKFNCVAFPNCEMKLPSGSYEVSVLGSPAGGLIPKEKAFSFTVESGVIKYLGFIVGDSDLLKFLEKNNMKPESINKVVISAKDYGLCKPKSFFNPECVPGEPFIEFFILDDHETDTNEFLKKYPQFIGHKILFDPLR